MNRWNQKQKQLAAESLNNLAIGIFIVGIVTPLFSGVKNVNLYFEGGLITFIASLFLFVTSLMILKK